MGIGVFLALFALLESLAHAEERPSPPTVVSLREVKTSMTEGTSLARDLSTLIGVSLTPLLGMSALGFVAWWVAEEEARAQLPFHQQPWFWGTGLSLILILWFGHRVPIVRKGFKLMKLWESKFSAALAIPIVSSQLVPALLKPAGIIVTSVSAWVSPLAWAAPAQPAEPSMTSSPNLLASVLAWSLALGLGFIVWVAGHAVNVLALVSPIALIDAIMKAMKSTLVAALILANVLSPWVGLIICVTYVFAAAWMSGWSVRLAVFGWVFSTDLILLRSRRAQVNANSMFAFSAAGLIGIPVRTWGRLVVGEERIRFEYRVNVVQYRSVDLPSSSQLVVEKGLVSPVLVSLTGPRAETLIRFPPRFRPHSDELGRLLGGVLVRDMAVIRGLSAARVWIADQLGRGFTWKRSPRITS